MNAGLIVKGKAMHIDTSSKLYERTHTRIAYKIAPSGEHKGAALHIRFKNDY